MLNINHHIKSYEIRLKIARWMPSHCQLVRNNRWMSDRNSVTFRFRLACEQAHIWEHTRERQRANSKPEWSFREESGDDGRWKWACPDLYKFFISASPERSEIPLVKKRERWQNCQSIMFHGKRLDPQGVGNLSRVQQLAWPRVRRTIVCVYS